MLGLKFRRQHVIAGFVVDFYCAELRLVLELDGRGHGDSMQAEYDEDRTAYLESRGLRVIRIARGAVREESLRMLLQGLTRRPPLSTKWRGGQGVR
jgi:very-short-patch-repair endonuclease